MKRQIKSTTIIAIKKGNEPANISFTVVFSVPLIPTSEDLTVNTFIPNGGVIIPVSIAIIIISPNQTMSYPRLATMGHISGVVSNRIEVESKIHPRSIKINMKIKMIPMGAIFSP